MIQGDTKFVWGFLVEIVFHSLPTNIMAIILFKIGQEIRFPGRVISLQRNTLFSDKLYNKLLCYYNKFLSQEVPLLFFDIIMIKYFLFEVFVSGPCVLCVYNIIEFCVYFSNKCFLSFVTISESISCISLFDSHLPK